MAVAAHVLEVSSLRKVIVVVKFLSGVSAEHTRATPDLAAIQEPSCVLTRIGGLAWSSDGVFIAPSFCPQSLLVFQLAQSAVRLLFNAGPESALGAPFKISFSLYPSAGRQIPSLSTAFVALRGIRHVGILFTAIAKRVFSQTIFDVLAFTLPT
jgi:hypothetical protein